MRHRRQRGAARSRVNPYFTDRYQGVGAIAAAAPAPRSAPAPMVRGGGRVAPPTPTDRPPVKLPPTFPPFVRPTIDPKRVTVVRDRLTIAEPGPRPRPGMTIDPRPRPPQNPPIDPIPEPPPPGPIDQIPVPPASSTTTTAPPPKPWPMPPAPSPQKPPAFDPLPELDEIEIVPEVTVAPPPPSTIPWRTIGIAAALGLGAFMLFRKK